MFADDSVLEDAIPEDLLLELSEIRVVDVRVECLDDVPSAGLLARPEISPPVCQGSSAPEGPAVGSPSTGSIDVQVGSSMPQTDDIAVTSSDMLIDPTGLANLEVNGHGAEDLMDVPSVEGPMGASGVEIPMGVALSLDYPVPSMHDPGHNAAFVDVLSFGSTSALPTLGFTLFLSNLQVHASHASLYLPMGVPFADFCSCRVSWTWWLIN